MHPLIAALPLALVIFAVAIARRPPLQAAALGAIMAGILFLFRDVAPLETGAIALGRTALLAATVASVMLPGLLFVEITRHSGAAEQLGDWIRDLPAPTAIKAALLVGALGPMLESLTGFGISLIVLLPAALAILPRAAALRVALVGMNIMPWGTLGLATLVGAQIAGLDADRIGITTAWTSAFVFPLATLIAAGFAAGPRPATMSLAALVGSAFSVLLYAANIALGPAIAGVAAGLATLAGASAVLRVTHGSVTAPPKAAWSYVALFLTALVQRALIDAVPAMRDISLVVGDTSWAPLTSPGVALLVVAALAARRDRLAKDFRSMAARAVKPVAAVGLFLLMAVTMTEGGMVATLTAGLDDLPVSVALAIVAVAGFLSGYITGSNVGGNALLMPTAAGLGSELGDPYLFAAVQNSAAGHAVLASLPIVLLLASLAQADDQEQNGILRFGLVVGALNSVLVLCAALLAQ